MGYRTETEDEKAKGKEAGQKHREQKKVVEQKREKGGGRGSKTEKYR